MKWESVITGAPLQKGKKSPGGMVSGRSIAFSNMGCFNAACYMNTLQNAPVCEQIFTQFLFHNRRNRMILYLAGAAILIQFIIFKYLYPFANYIDADSFAYLKAADKNLIINFYPVGYSKFLRLVSVFAKPDIILVSIQFLMIQCSMLFLLFTIFYFYSAGRITQTMLVCFMVFNPLFLQLANMVSSDGLFLALSMTWFSLLLWLIYNPSNKIICWHALVLFVAFTVRYNALIYPFISAVAFWLSQLPLRKKIIGLAGSLLLIGWFIGLSMFQYKKLTGYWQYSPFSGWQLANNALYAYREVDRLDREPVPFQFRELDNMIRNFYDSTPNLSAGQVGTQYMWLSRFPLMQYLDSTFKAKKSPVTNFEKWASLGPFYSKYGLYLIKKYPAHFIRHFVWPNFLTYIAPPVEFLGNYNAGKTTVPESVIKWFGYKNNQATTRMKSSEVRILQYYPFLISITNLTILVVLLTYTLLKGWQYNASFNKSILIAGFTWISNAGFTIFASSAALRFQAFPALINITFLLLLIECMVGLIRILRVQNQGALEAVDVV
jgi:hypothetical protein